MTDRDLLNQSFGNPFKERKFFEARSMMLFRAGRLFPKLPFSRMYINREIEKPLINTFSALERDDLLQELKTFDGCFNPRCIRGYEDPCIPSIHSWALAVDFNAKDNPLGFTREQAIAKGLNPFTEEFLQVWRETGWVCGADFNRKDLMHFQWTVPFEK